MVSNIVVNDVIRVDRLAEFFPEDFGWNWNEILKITDITTAIENGQLEEKEMFNPNVPMAYTWHIGRIIYFINHPEKIKYIKIENIDNGYFVLPTPIIIEGYHRFAAAMWLYSYGKIKEIYCSYDGRTDILSYLKGETDRKPSKWTKKMERTISDIHNCYIITGNGEYYCGIVNGELSLDSNIRKAKKLSQLAATTVIETLNTMFTDDEYKIITEKIVY